MKKISVVLLSLLVTFILSGCGRGEKIVGSDAAKLLLVEERLDSKSLKDSKINLSFLSNSININRKSSSKVPSIKAKRVGDVGVKRADNETGVEAKKQGNKIVWTNFEEYSNAISYFDSFVNNIEKQAKNAGRLIDETKNKIDSNNVWVKSLLYDLLLQVDANKDVVMRRDNQSYEIVTRSTNEQGVDVFDIFNGDEGSQYGRRVRKIGDYRYEYSYISDDGAFEHFFIADKSRGYWVVQSPVNGHQFSMTIIKDDKCYDFTTDVGSNEIGMIKIITSDTKCDIGSFHYDTFTFYPGAFKNIQSLSIDVDESEILSLDSYDTSGYDGYKVLFYTKDKEYTTIGDTSVDVNLTNGKTLKVNDEFVNGKVKFIISSVDGNADGMHPRISFEVEGKTNEEKIANLEKFVEETGLEFIRSNEEIFSSIRAACQDAKASLNSISWNGINIDNTDSYADAIEIEKNKLPTFSSMYKEVKDNTVLSRNQQGSLDRRTKFPYVISSSFNGDYKNNTVNLNNVSLTVDDFTLFENNKEYNIQFALAQYSEEENGYFALLPLEVENSKYVTYTGQDKFTVSLNNLSFVLPVPSIGDYELVAYVSDKDGIRVTRPQPVKFNSVESNEISVHNYTATVNKTDEGYLGVHSELNDNVVLEIENPKDSYSYSELYRLLSTEAYNYGIPSSEDIEVMDSSSNWVKVNTSSNNLTSGTYRLAFTNQNNLEVFVYTTIV
ncbi:MAG: hypothetical protein E7177_05795 [Erysipelotrichaceae bacterium]|nr:hypothetical protein [Erysipelotrichaceae bacterium]